jgi:aconitate hydratase
MIAIGAGGLDVTLAMAGEPFYLKVPKVLGVKLTGRLKRWVSSKDVILEMLRRRSVKGGIGFIVEYWGLGVKTLSATERATIANMGAELGATTTIFPSDEMTEDFLRRQGRADAWAPLSADEGAEYDETEEINLSRLEPLIATPGSPDNVVKVSEVEGTPVVQVIIGSSVNFSYKDLMVAAGVVKEHTVSPGVSLEINPGSRQVLENVERAGAAAWLTHGGARIHQSGCLGCIGMGQAPATGAVSVRTFPRNFPGRSGTEDDRVYLSSPETAVATAVFGRITDPRKLGRYPRVVEPKKYAYNDSLIIKPLSEEESKNIEVIRGPNIAPFPALGGLDESFDKGYEAMVLLKVGDNITTDHILPAGNKILPLRSNIPLISEYVYERVDKSFAKRCKDAGGGIIVGGENYGQGSSREHAALAPRYLGIRVKIAKGFARIHRSNLINFGIVPLVFVDPGDYGAIEQLDTLGLPELKDAIEEGRAETYGVIAGKKRIPLKVDLSERERASILAGGLLNLIRR